MKRNRAFWDASAIVPLCVYESDSSRARQLMRKHNKQIVWWGTMAEARSAFARADRKGLLSDKDKEQAIRQLRTGDALQLAAALISCGNNPRRKVFVCFDDPLATIAEEIGFNVIKT
jgi:hypothetical protein